MNRPTIAIIGAGAVGATTAYTLTLKNIASRVIVIDVDEEKEEGEVMDMTDALIFVETGNVQCGDYKDARNADIIIITAGAAQKSGETRLDLLAKNAAITRSIFKGIGKIKKDAIIIVISNPVDVITYLIQKISRLPVTHVIGSGTALDTARLKKHVAEHLGVSAQSVHGYVLGEHGDSEFVAWSTVTVGGANASSLAEMTAVAKQHIETRVKKSAYDIIQKKGSTYYGIASAACDIVEAIVFDQKKILPVSSRLSGWNGVSDVCLGAPAVIGANGVEKHWPVKLTASEKKKLSRSAHILKTSIASL